MKRLFTTILLSISSFSFVHAEEPDGWSNPILPQRADPHVFLHKDGYYYMVATAPEYDRIELRRAKTLGGFSKAKAEVIWRKHDKGEMGAHIWAPEIHHIGGSGTSILRPHRQSTSGRSARMC